MSVKGQRQGTTAKDSGQPKARWATLHTVKVLTLFAVAEFIFLAQTVIIYARTVQEK